MSDVYVGRHRRLPADPPSEWLKWALTQRQQSGTTHRRAAVEGGAPS